MIYKNIAFLFGSGVSKYSGLKNVNEITDAVLSTKKVARNGDLNYYFYDYITDCNSVRSIQKFLFYLKDIIDEYHNRLKIPYETNYEELYYLLYQIEKSEEKEYENPAIYPLIKNIELIFKDEISFHDNDLERYVRESKRYIHYIVYHLLQKSNGKLDQFNIISKVQEFAMQIDIFSLNHDILLETYFENNSISFNYGFEPDESICVFNVELFEKKNSINLYKLHGSLDWFRFQNQKESNIYRVPLNYNLQIDRYNTLDNRLQTTNGIPMFLIGTFNKMLNYLGDIYEILFDIFKKQILNSDLLIISGYGFNDKGINARISHFIKQPNKKIVIVHPNINELSKNARGNYYINILNNPKVNFIEKKFEEVLRSDLLKDCK
ncbi:MAG: SIR2 family protein [Bacteroidales bacterium]|jgi:hypothetical protein|nr:SIR2 family protein [Bacteroidales bacterium]